MHELIVTRIGPSARTETENVRSGFCKVHTNTGLPQFFSNRSQGNPIKNSQDGYVSDKRSGKLTTQLPLLKSKV